jgi:hypothetical protein
MSNRSSYTAYVDETGTNILNTSVGGESNIFICTAVLVSDANQDMISHGLSEISARYCRGAEIKSSKIGNNHARRQELLRQVCKFDFHYYALIVNKDYIDKTSGLQFKKTFYKRINRMLYDRVRREFGDLHVVADTIGGIEYMASFDKYLKEKMPNLISKFTHEFRDSKTTPLLQLADLISGTLGYCFVDSRKGEHSENLRNIVRKKELYIDSLPQFYKNRTEQSSYTPDGAILVSSRNRAIEFVEENWKLGDDASRMQVAIVQKFLFQQFMDYDQEGFLSATMLRDYLEALGFERLSEQGFRSAVIGKIRDAGVILSGTSKGYRLAISDSDIHDYLSHNVNIIIPMLSRLKRAQAVIKADIGSGVDILANEEFGILKHLVECYTDRSLEHNAMRKDNG